MIVGGGPAGLMSAYKALEEGKSVTLFEKRSEDTFDLRPGIMVLNEESVFEDLIHILEKEFPEEVIFSHELSKPNEKKGIDHRKSKSSLLKKLKEGKEDGFALLQTKVIQRIIFEAIKKKQGIQNIVNFNSTIEAIDGRSQVLTSQTSNKDFQIQSSTGFSDVIFADGTAIFKDLNQGVVDSKSNPTPRELLTSSLGLEDKVNINKSNEQHGHVTSQGAMWVTLSQNATENAKKSNDLSLDSMVLNDKIIEYEDTLRELKNSPEENKEEIENIELKLKKVERFKDYKFYIFFVKDNSKCWFAGNVPPEFIGLDSDKKNQEMKEHIFNLVDFCNDLSTLKITKEDFLLQKEARKTSDLTEKQKASDRLKQAQSWLMGENEIDRSSSLKQLESNMLDLGLDGNATSIGDANYQPSFYMGEGTNNALIEPTSFLGDITPWKITSDNS